MSVSKHLLTDLSRPRLHHMARWIREDLDPVIAREGSEVLLADDVLVLHDFFQALITSASLTALDLRATGVHKAILDISGIATRWPGRLCDDCDEILSIWTAKFGRLDTLHPFLYGRGGRLEGIATAAESSKESLRDRWYKTCPDKLATRRSHRAGGLGFRAGMWWINAVFAWHAGIIDYDTIDGGICHDKHAAYAVLLSETGELEASSLSAFTYRCSRNDRGKYCLTAASSKARTPIRVLRSHKANSIWGPKAGVRYDGLYRVAGWSVHAIRSGGNMLSDQEFGDVLYDVFFEREDPEPAEKVLLVPTASQLDDYSEYKRLRKVYREHNMNTATTATEVLTLQHMAPQIAPAEPFNLRAAAKNRSLFEGTEPHECRDLIPSYQQAHHRVRLPMYPTTDYNNAASNTRQTSRLSSATMISSRGERAGPVPIDIGSSAQLQVSQESVLAIDRPTGLVTTVAPTEGKHGLPSLNDVQPDIRQVAPWIDFDKELGPAKGSTSKAQVILNA